MSTQTKKEWNAVTFVYDYVDATAGLQLYLEESNKTTLRDGTIFVSDGAPNKTTISITVIGR